MEPSKIKPEDFVREQTQPIAQTIDVVLSHLHAVQLKGGTKTAAGREIALAITRLEEASMWLSCALARLAGNKRNHG